jgi:hypothetical protein
MRACATISESFSLFSYRFQVWVSAVDFSTPDYSGFNPEIFGVKCFKLFISWSRFYQRFFFISCERFHGRCSLLVAILAVVSSLFRLVLQLRTGFSIFPFHLPISPHYLLHPFIKSLALRISDQSLFSSSISFDCNLELHPYSLTWIYVANLSWSFWLLYQSIFYADFGESWTQRLSSLSHVDFESSLIKRRSFLDPG